METQAQQDLLNVEKALDGDMDAFGRLVETYEGRLLRYIMRISSHSMDESEEILQEVFMSCWKNLQGYDHKLAFSTWIYRIAHNATISSHRKKTTRGEDTAVSFDAKLYDKPTEELSFGEEFDQKIQADKVAKVFENMKEEYKEILILRYFEDLAYDEISDILKKPSGTVATLLSRAKKEFQQTFINIYSENDIS